MNNTYAITKHKIKELAELHVKRYSNMIASGSPHVRVSECQSLLNIWVNVINKGCSWDVLTIREQQEVFEAYEDELNG